MRKKSTILFFTCTIISFASILFTGCSKDDETPSNTSISKVANVSTAGTLATVAASYLTTVTNLTVTGTIDARDFKTMRDAMPLLRAIDLSGSTVVAYKGSAGPNNVANSTDYPANGIPAYAFLNPLTYNGKQTLISFIYPSSVTIIGAAAFTDCSSLTGPLTIPSSVTTIDDGAFNGCRGFTGSLNIPSSVTTIGKYTFGGCAGFFQVDNLNPNYSCLDGILYNKDKTTLIQCPASKSGSLTVPASVTTIGGWAFQNCSGLTGSLTISAKITAIGSRAFLGCSGFTSIYASAITPINIDGSSYIFDGVTKTIPLHVPVGSKALYAAAYGWKDFTNIVDDIIATN